MSTLSSCHVCIVHDTPENAIHADMRHLPEHFFPMPLSMLVQREGRSEGCFSAIAGTQFCPCCSMLQQLRLSPVTPIRPFPSFPRMRKSIPLSPGRACYSNYACPLLHDRVIVQEALVQITWYHNITLVEKLEDSASRLWYAQHTVLNGWSRNVLVTKRDGSEVLRALAVLASQGAEDILSRCAGAWHDRHAVR
jgi:hypothetical protein